MTGDKSNLISRLAAAPFVANVMPISAGILADYVRVLSEEGYTAVEVLCRPTEDALATVRELNEMPERKLIALGIGTLTSEKDARAAAELNPDFLVSPVFSRKVLAVAVEAGILYIPAVESFQHLQDVLDALADYGLPLKALKLSPAVQMDAYYVQMLATIYPGVSFFPTGDPRLESLESYVDWKKRPGVAAPMGARFVPRDMLERRDFEAVRVQLRKIRALAEQAARERESQ